MKKNILCNSFLIALCFVLASCGSSIKVVNSWMDDSLKGYAVDNVLVIGISRDNITQSLFEDTFVEAFAAENITAMPSYKTTGGGIMSDQNAVEKVIVKTGAKTVLITRIRERDEKTNTYSGPIHHAPTPYYRGMLGYYNSAIQSPATTTTKHIVLLESNLYDAASEKLIWTAQSEAVNVSRVKEDFKKFVKVLMADLRQQNVL